MYPEPLFNNSYGRGLEGLMNYTNSGLLEGMFIPGFLAMLWIVGMYVASKSEWKMSNVMAFISLICLLLSWIASAFTVVNGLFIFAFGILTAWGIAWSFIEIGSR